MDSVMIWRMPALAPSSTRFPAALPKKSTAAFFRTVEMLLTSMISSQPARTAANPVPATRSTPSERAKTTGSWPASVSSRTTSLPIRPVPPATATRIDLPFARCRSYPPDWVARWNVTACVGRQTGWCRRKRLLVSWATQTGKAPPDLSTFCLRFSVISLVHCETVSARSADVFPGRVTSMSSDQSLVHFVALTCRRVTSILPGNVVIHRHRRRRPRASDDGLQSGVIMAQDVTGRPDDSTVSRRHLVTSGTGLLAGFGLAALVPGVASAAPADPVAAETPRANDLALFRPVQVSSTDYAATPAEFAVDGLARIGAQGSGWRAAAGDGQWIIVDLQGRCQVSSVVLTFEARPGDPAFDAGASRSHTTGTEVLSSYATVFDLDVSQDGRSWRTVYSTDAGPGGVVTIPLAGGVTARWVRFSASQRSTTNPLGLNGFQVYGTTRENRPPARGWTSFSLRDHDRPPALSVSVDGTVPLESGWALTMQDWAPSTDGAVRSGANVDTRGWLPATVPGTVLASLVEQGQLPDPVFGMNNMHIPEAVSDA